MGACDRALPTPASHCRCAAGCACKRSSADVMPSVNDAGPMAVGGITKPHEPRHRIQTLSLLMPAATSGHRMWTRARLASTHVNLSWVSGPGILQLHSSEERGVHVWGVVG